jgi:hypothetical protein
MIIFRFIQLISLLEIKIKMLPINNKTKRGAKSQFQSKLKIFLVWVEIQKSSFFRFHLIPYTKSLAD